MLEVAFGRTAASNRDAIGVRPIVTPAPSEPNAIEQVTTGLMTLLTGAIRSAVDQVLTERLGSVPQQTAETWETVRGATVIEREVTKTVYEEWVADGWCYLFASCDGQLMAIGETHKTPERRLLDGEYNGNKDREVRWQVLHSFQTDNRGDVEKRLHRLAKQAGACPVPNTRGTFERDERIIADFCRLPKKLCAEHLSRYIEQGRLFEPPMFML